MPSVEVWDRSCCSIYTMMARWICLVTIWRVSSPACGRRVTGPNGNLSTGERVELFRANGSCRVTQGQRRDVHGVLQSVNDARRTDPPAGPVNLFRGYRRPQDRHRLSWTDDPKVARKFAELRANAQGAQPIPQPARRPTGRAKPAGVSVSSACC